MSADPYAHLADRFVAHYDSLRGALRLALVAAQLDEHLPAPPASIVDLGGGAGHQAIPLAKAGYDVTVVDPSGAMLERARAALADHDPETAERVRLVHRTARQAPASLDGRGHNATLCHGVLPYVEDAKSVIDACVELTRPGGVVSVVFKNADALAMRPALEGRWADAEAAFRATVDIGGMGEPTHAHRREDVVSWLAAAGCEVVQWYGIRIMTDHLGDQPADDLAAVLPVESHAARTDPYRALGRLIHVIAAPSADLR